jgi:hypothetical protein
MALTGRKAGIALPQHTLRVSHDVGGAILPVAYFDVSEVLA